MAFTFGKPRTTVVSLTPSWQMDELTVIGWGTGVAPLNFLYLGLFNNDALGRSLVIWYGLTAYLFANTNVFYMIYGTRGATIANPSNINPQRGAPPGLMWFDQVGAAYTDPFMFFVPSGTFQVFPFGFPGVIVPVGYSLVFGGDSKSNQINATYWYLPTAHV